MNAFKHTSGVWRAQCWTSHAPVTVVVDDPERFTGVRVIAECESEDDAMLVSAAKELLEALRGMLDAFVEDPLDANTDSAIEKAYAAIAKASTESPADLRMREEEGKA